MATQARAKARFNPIWLQGLVCGAVATFASPSALLLAILLCPTAAVFLLQTAQRPVVRPVLLFGLAGSLEPLAALWRGGHTLDLSLSIGLDLANVCIAWCAQAAGWLLAQLAPVGFRLALDASANARAAQLRARRARLETEWGFQPRIGADASAEADAG